MTLDTDILIILRAGRSSLHRIWTLLARRSIDIVLSIYDDAELAGDEFILVHRASGGKYQAAVQLFADHPDLVERYKFFWFLDDDMFVPFTSIYNVARACRLYNFVICQPSLTPDSFFSWPITVSNEAFVWRATDFIEIMCPVMRRDFLIQAIPHMRHTFTGWGQEFIWRRLLQESHELGGIIDVAPVTHTRPVGGGAIYDRYEGGAKGAFAEVLMVLQKLGIPHDPSFKNFYGLSRSRAVGLVSGERFLESAIKGYEAFQVTVPEAYERCIADIRVRLAENELEVPAYLPIWPPVIP